MGVGELGSVRVGRRVWEGPWFIYANQKQVGQYIYILKFINNMSEKFKIIIII